MKTIEEYNKESRKAGVMVFTYEYKIEWKSFGIFGLSSLACPCGCKGELLRQEPQTHTDLSRRTRIKCQKTNKEGWLLLDGSAMGIIEGIEWDKPKKEKEDK